MMQLRGAALTGVGFIGLGVMGAPMCGHLAERVGVPVYVHDLSAGAVAEAVSRGAAACGSAAEISREADAVILCLASEPQIRAVVTDLFAGRNRPRVIIDCGTTAVALTQEMAQLCRARGSDWVDAPIARGRDAARTGTLSIMVGAAPALFDEVRPILACFGSDVTRCGDTGAGQVVKILNNKVMIQTVHALAEALAMARAAGVAGEMLFQVFAMGSADSVTLRNQGMRALLPGAFPHQAFPTSYARKDLALALALAQDTGIEARLAEETAALLDRALGAGFVDEYYPVILKLLERPAAA